jgi:cytochrome c peroxidase
MKKYLFSVIPAWVLLLSFPMICQAGDTTPSAQQTKWSEAAGRAGNALQGEVFFNSKHGGQWSCASCHGAPAVVDGKHASTGKTIKPLAPAGNPDAFTDTAKIDKWFRRNCKDVLSRECTPAEKADVLAYLLNMKR